MVETIARVNAQTVLKNKYNKKRREYYACI